jgi:hypothetical protein
MQTVIRQEPRQRRLRVSRLWFQERANPDDQLSLGSTITT